MKKTVYFKNLPKDVQDQLKSTPPELDNSYYTCYEDTAYIRAEVTIKNKVYSAEISLGSCDIKHSDYAYDDDKQAFVDDEGREVDQDEYAEHFMNDLYSCCDLNYMEVRLELLETIEE